MGNIIKPFLDATFLLDNSSAERLYFDYAEPMPIIDYHNHLPPLQIAQNYQFQNLTEIWLKGDHYKWRAMRTLGIDEKFITGNASDQQKFNKWAEATPQTLRNPLYHWTHLELQRYFGIDELLNTASAARIYAEANDQLQSPNLSTQALLKKMRVEVLCTTDDPLDDLQYHKSLAQQNPGFQVFPTWRPDKALAVDSGAVFRDYLQKLSAVTNSEIKDLEGFLTALKNRHDYFAAQGCRLSDRGISRIVSVPYTSGEVVSSFKQLVSGKDLRPDQVEKLQSHLLLELARMDHSRGWVQQYHLGALRNTNSNKLQILGPDCGYDSIGDYQHAGSLCNFLDRLDQTDQLAKTILYNLNPADNETMASLIGNFNNSSHRGKMQFGAAWWFLDQLDGMEKQLNALSNMSLLSCFVGMLTDSRSFLSFPRHEYFRRLLCRILGDEIEKGLIPEDYELVGGLVQNVCYYNAKEYFGF